MDIEPFIAERLDPRLSIDFYRVLERYMGGKPEQIEPVFQKNYERWWRDHAGSRAEWFRGDLRSRIQHLRPLQGLRVLDFGCGTGSSSLVFAECGATVVGIEPDEISLEVARVRVRDCGFEQQVKLVQIPYLSGGTEQLPLDSEGFDLVSLIGVMEHMLPAERSHCLREVHRLLKKGSGEVFFYDTPNRLFPFDHHTTNLWFSNWLPTPLARRYSVFRGRVGRDSNFLRMGGVGISRRAIDRLTDPAHWRLVYEMSVEDVRKEFLWIAQKVPWLWRTRPKLAEKLMLSAFWVLVRGSAILGVKTSSWTMRHVLGYVKT